MWQGGKDIPGSKVMLHPEGESSVSWAAVELPGEEEMDIDSTLLILEIWFQAHLRSLVASFSGFRSG